MLDILLINNIGGMHNSDVEAGAYPLFRKKKHLFLHFPLANVLWRTVHIAFNITPPNSVNALFGTWLNGIEPDLARHIRVGVCALLWTI